MRSPDHFAWPDTDDLRQQNRQGNDWPRHRARARRRQQRRLRAARAEAGE